LRFKMETLRIKENFYMLNTEAVRPLPLSYFQGQYADTLFKQVSQ
jgi:hypothetical protein